MGMETKNLLKFVRILDQGCRLVLSLRVTMGWGVEKGGIFLLVPRLN